MTTPNPRSSDRASQSQYGTSAPRAVPRSQYASIGRSSMRRPTTSQAGPRYFSSPFRAPLTQHDRHESFVEHQKSVSHAQSKTVQSRSSRVTAKRRSSHAPYGSTGNNQSSLVSNTSNQSLSNQNRAGNSPVASRQSQVTREPDKLPPAERNSKVISDRSSAQRPSLSESATIDALNAAISAAIQKPDRNVHTTVSQETDHQQIPPDSPTSTYSQESRFSPQQKPHAQSKRVIPSSNAAQVGAEVLSSPRGQTPHSEKSSSSTKPLLGLGIESSGMSKRVPENMRPPPLNIKAVRDMESRGSITSLSDMIRRATRLAANLDRGKTASRLGIWDILNHTDMIAMRKRESAETDVLDKFPDPGRGAPPKTSRPTTMWPREREVNANVRVENEEKQEKSIEKPRRKCCGLSMTAFMVLLVIVILLITAAVLIPIFLVAAQRHAQHSSGNLKQCATSHPCHNGGISIVDNNACSCACVAGFTGNDCSMQPGPNCVTVDLTDGMNTFKNATLGSMTAELLQSAEGQMNIPLNASILLSVFSQNNLTCAGEDSLVKFNDINAQQRKRFVVVSSLEADASIAAKSPVSAYSTRTIATNMATSLSARQIAEKTSNNVVYQPTLTQSSTTMATASPSTSAASATASSSIIPLVPTTNVTWNQLQFAQLVVFFVLTESRVPSTAVVAQQSIAQYFRAGGVASGNTTVDVVHMDNMEITANFAQLAIILSNGKVIGGTGSNR